MMRSIVFRNRRIFSARPLTQRFFSSAQKTVSADDPAAIPLVDEAVHEQIIKVPKPTRPANESIETKRARLLYICRKRGILETDLLLSTFAQKYMKSFTMKQLDEFDNFMDENDWDIFYWATETNKPPQHIQEMSILPLLIEHSKNKQREILRMPNLSWLQIHYYDVSMSFTRTTA